MSGRALRAPAADLVSRAAAGDAQAFADIFRTYQHVVYRFSRAMTGSDAAAEDLTQETFVALYANLARYDATRASFTTYLYGIVRNLSRERLRHERRFLSLDALGCGGDAQAYESDPADRVESAQVVRHVRHALGKLPPCYREVIVLCDLHELSYGDAAAIVGASTAAVRSRLHRARQLLKRRLARLAANAPRRSPNPAGCAI